MIFLNSKTTFTKILTKFETLCKTRNTQNTQHKLEKLKKDPKPPLYLLFPLFSNIVPQTPKKQACSLILIETKVEVDAPASTCKI